MILATLLAIGKTVLRPFGDNERYDLVIDEEGRFVRVQCKTGKLKAGALVFATSSHTYKGKSKDYRGQIEAFAVYSPELKKVYLVPVGVVGRREATLRIEPSKNNQVSGVRFASEFEVVSGGVAQPGRALGY